MKQAYRALKAQASGIEPRASCGNTQPISHDYEHFFSQLCVITAERMHGHGMCFRKEMTKHIPRVAQVQGCLPCPRLIRFVIILLAFTLALFTGLISLVAPRIARRSCGHFALG